MADRGSQHGTAAERRTWPDATLRPTRNRLCLRTDRHVLGKGVNAETRPGAPNRFEGVHRAESRFWLRFLVRRCGDSHPSARPTRDPASGGSFVARQRQGHSQADSRRAVLAPSTLNENRSQDPTGSAGRETCGTSALAAERTAYRRLPCAAWSGS